MDDELGASWAVDCNVCRLLVCGCIFLVRFCCNCHCKFCKPLTDLLSCNRSSLSSARLSLCSYKQGALLGLLTGLLCQSGPSSWPRRFSDHRCSPICGELAQHRAPSPRCSVLLCPPLPSFSPNSNLLRRPHEVRRFVRSFGLERIDRSDQSAARHLQILNFATFNLSKTTL